MRKLFLIALFIVVLDQLTKQWIVLNMLLIEEQVIDIAPPYLRLVMAWNTGINFGLGGGMVGPWILIGIAAVLSVGIAYWALRRDQVSLHIGAGMVVGGAIGNSIDRVRFGAVADFLNMSCCGLNNPYAFNVADIAIFAGVGVLLIFGGDPKEKTSV